MYTDWKPDGLGGHTAFWQLALIDVPAITWVTQDGTETTIINLARLHEGIEGGITRFQQSLETATGQTARDGFESVFDKHGWMPTSTQQLS